MSAIDLTRQTRERADRRRRVLLAAGLLATGWLVVTAVTGGGSPGGTRLGPTVAVAPRDLATSLRDWGVLQRSGERTVAHAGAVDADGGSVLPSGSGDDGGDGGELPTENVAYVSDDTTRSSTSASSTSTSSTSTSPTTTPCVPGSSSSSTSTSSTTSTTACPPASATTTTPPDPRPTDPPGDGGPAGEEPPPDEPTDGTPKNGRPLGDGGADGDGGPSGTGGPGGNGSPPGIGDPSGTGDPDGDGGEAPTATLTSALDVGAVADRGTVLYTADQQPVVALLGDLPAWRTLQEGVDDGADVRQLEENLVALGYGAGLDVDETYTADTASAVEAWETALGRTSPDGVVAMGDVVYLTAAGDVLGHEAEVGDTLRPGSPVLTIGSEQRIVVAEVDATVAGGWAPGATVDLEWADGSTSQGTVFGTGRDVTDGDVELIVVLGAGESGAGERRSGAQAAITLVDARRDGVLAVPVGAVVDDDGSPAVRVAQAGAPDRVVPVETGLVADGWIEITAGIEAGDEIRLPG
ncbi:MAG TPA: peptidoglycan-binding protein [Acidimicrobiales bacterium]|nr:peptidoglycan-binding protein [Acidimicrobiales bacterium]